ncbi:MAG: SH3 domain-containing protein [Methylocystis sp.]|nr:SH3 domain-containing protein [Methylocystis sp.]MBI3275862.1 SH3 domain-containing protein [Methylocystis sp.]
MQLKLVSFLAAATLAASAGSAVAYPGFTANMANLRSGPGTGFAPVATLAPQTMVNVMRCKRGWCLVSSQGGTGYVSAATLRRGVQQPGAMTTPFDIFTSGFGLVTEPFVEVGTGLRSGFRFP